MPAARRTRPLVPVGALVAATAASVLAGCSSSGSGSPGSGTLRVDASDTACRVSVNTLAAGPVSVAVSNTGSKVTEVYVYAPGDRIVTERENIGPGTRTTVTTELKPGSYEIACKPGMTGDGIRQKITVTGGDASATVAADPRLDAAVAAYRGYVQQQADATLPVVQQFAAALKTGDVARAQALFAPSRVGWERTEPVAESFGDIDPKTDTREDGVEPGQQWTGWHRLEKSLWVNGTVTPEDAQLADQLVTDLQDRQKRIGTAEITATSMANGAKELLDEVATGKVTGEEDRYSHTDLSDFAANVEGAQKAYELLRPVVVETDPQLVATLDGGVTGQSEENACSPTT
ncbi:iron uptake system protein EfeO [Kitasatospora herbaricolor]|uniref:Cupredoxin domain-containing protein n=1 Tax=Kitasatospora herbaricolor TaxID=68217 RepID=A0ABZ1W1D4_9ACTN|nr:iron uptake system protein EfeO [Kitasatospora herbaricolor]